MQQQSWAVFLLLSSSTPFNLKMTAKRGQQKRPGQQTMKEAGKQQKEEQRARKIKAQTQKKYTDGDSREQKEKIMVLFSSFVTTQYYSDIFLL